jgi:lysophospholipase
MLTLPPRVVPNLPAQFLLPDGWNDGSFVNDGRFLAYGYVLPRGTPRAAVVILPGRAEFREKYFELMRDLLARNMAVFCMDWFGQGSSGRYLSDTHKDHSLGFHLHLADLNAFTRDIVIPTLEKSGNANTPLLLWAHSMGGNIGTRFLMTHLQPFAGALIGSPMMGIHGLEGQPAWLLRAFTTTLTPLHTLYAPLPWKGGWNETECKPPGEDVLTSDPVRDTVLRTWYCSNPRLQLGMPTWGWIHHALHSCAIINNDDLLKKISAPTLFITAGDEQVVDNVATLRIAAKIPDARQVEIAGARHEIVMERDSMRQQMLEYFDNFLPACNIR